jgi:hypothetical protein
MRASIAPLRGSEFGGQFHSDIRCFHHRVGNHSRLQLEFVRRLARDQCHKTVRTRLDLDLGSDTIFGHPRDDPEKPIARRLFSWIIPTLLAGDLRRQPGQIDPIDVAPPTGPDGCLDPTRVRPTTHGVRAHPEEFSYLTDPVLRHLHKVARVERLRIRPSILPLRVKATGRVPSVACSPATIPEHSGRPMLRSPSP